MDFEATSSVVLKVLTLGFTVGFLMLGMKVAGVVVAQGIAGTVGLIVGILLYRRLKLPPLSLSRATARDLIRGAAPIFTMALMISLQPYIDSNVMSWLVPQDVIGWYG